MNLIQILADASSGCPEELEPIINLIKNGVMPLFQIGIPILLILFGTIDLGKAVIASDDKAIKAATSQLIKRAIAAVAVFFVVTLVSLVISLVTNHSSSTIAGTTHGWQACWNNSNGGSK